MKQNVPEDCQLERELFHGTNKEACDNISHQGFSTTFAGKNGMDIYGQMHQLISYGKYYTCS